MPVLIDGNNLLHAALEADPERPPSRTTLCLLLGQWAQKTGERISVVFDGPAPNEQLARQTAAERVRVTYGGGESADDVIERMLAGDSAARRLVVVSSDGEVARAARRYRATPVRADEFWATMRRELARRATAPLEPPEKSRGLALDETERWLRELGLD
jgi:predicted RNA-binding protein with PIN domain